MEIEVRFFALKTFEDVITRSEADGVFLWAISLGE